MKEDKQLTIEGFEDFTFNEENLAEVREEIEEEMLSEEVRVDVHVSEKSRQICVQDLLK